MRWLVLPALLAAAPAGAQGAAADHAERDYCPERPGLNTPPCIIDRGRVSVETSLADWTLDRSGGDRADTVLIGDTEVRIGLSDAVEAQLGWTPFGIDRERGAGVVDRTTGVGDVTLGLKANLAHPDGDGFSVAVLPYLTLPVGRTGVGAGDWGVGALLPLSYDLSDVATLEATPEVDAAVDEDGHGRHLAVGGAAGLALKPADAVTLTGEVRLERDRDPAGHETHALAALSAGVMAAKNLQFDVLGAAGLNHSSPDVEVYGGVSVRL